MDAKAIVRSYFDAVNDERWDDVVALFCDDADLFVPSRRPKRGREAIGRFYEDIGSRFSDHRTEIVFLIAEGDSAAATVRYEGVFDGGGAIVTFATDTFVLEGGRIRELRIVFDTADFLRENDDEGATA